MLPQAECIQLTHVKIGVMLSGMSKPSEQAVRAEIEQRLCLEFPHAAPSTVSEFVDRAYARFGSSRIRDFVPLFVERDVRRQLSH